MEPTALEQAKHKSQEGVQARGLGENRRRSRPTDEPMEADQDPASTRPGSGDPYSGDGPGGRPLHTRHTPHAIL